MILKKFMVHAKLEAFTLEAVAMKYREQRESNSSKPLSDSGRKSGSIQSPSTETKHFKQSWKLKSDFSAYLDSGPEWSETGIALDFILPVKQVVIAMSSIIRAMQQGPEGIQVRALDLKVQSNMIDVLISTEANPDTLLRYAWDENSQLLGPQVLAGKINHLSEHLLAEIYAACFGRLGLLARTMRNAVKEVVPIDDMGALRWA